MTANQYYRLLEPTNVIASWSQSRDEVFDAGAYNQVQAHCRVLKAGTAGTIRLQTAAVNEVDAWVDVTGLVWTLSGTGSLLTSVNFLRFLRVATDGAVAGGPVALIDLVLKQ